MQSTYPGNLCELVEFSAADAWANFFLCVPDEFSAEYNLAARRIGSTWVTMLAKLDWAFFNRIAGLGVRETATETMLDEAISIYHDAGCRNIMLQLSPLAQPAQLPTWVESRGFQRGVSWAKTYRGNEPPLSVRTDLRIDEIGIEDAEAFARVNLTAFDMPFELEPMSKGIIGKQGWHSYLAFDGDQAVSAAAMYVLGEVAWLGFGGTLESHRKRGGQGALFSRRIADGLKLGCKWFVTETVEDTPESPNPSFHNMLRHGFKLAYLRPNYILQKSG